MIAVDEKVCPYCAETIKRAAIKCRWCGSDLTGTPTTDTVVAASQASTPAPTAAPTPASTPASAPAADDAEPRPPHPVVAPDEATEPDPSVPPDRPAWAAGRALTAVLAVLLVLGVVGLVFAARHQQNARSQAPLSAGARAALLDQATSLTQKALSYQAKSFDADKAAADGTMTASMRAQYDRTMAGVRDEVRKRGLVLQATVRASGIVSATSDQAEVLEFVNQTTTARGSTRQQLDENRLVVTLRRSADGGWLVAQLRAF